MTNTVSSKTTVALAGTLVLAGACWVVAVRQMSGMDMGASTELGRVGRFRRGASAGKYSVKVLPSPGELTSLISPPSSFDSSRLIARPRPVPPYLRDVEPSACWNASKIICCLSGAIPMPVSVTENAMTCSAPTRSWLSGDQPPAAGQDHLSDPPVGGGQAARHQAPGAHPPHVVGHPAALPADLGGEHRDRHPPPVGNTQRRQHVVIGQRHAAIGEELPVHLVRQPQLHPDISQPCALLVRVEPSTGRRRAGLAVT